MLCKQLVISALSFVLFIPFTSYGQGSVNQEQLRYQRALQEIEGVIADTGKLADPLSTVIVKSKAANLMWRFDRKRAQTIFGDLWKFIDQQGSEYLDQDEARTVLLKNLFPVNSALADSLLKELSARQKVEPSLGAQATGRDPGQRRLADISGGLVDHDSALAARLLEQSLMVGVTPASLSVLSRMREKNPILANYVASQSLDHLRSRPTIVALTGLHLLTSYIFPSESYISDSPEASGTDDRLRYQYFSVAYEILKISLGETDSFLTKEKRYTENDLRFRAIYQGQIALILAALAPRYGPQFVEELNLLARRFAGSTPANIATMSNFVVTRLRGERSNSDNPEIAIAVAIANGDFEEARRLIGKIEDEERRKTLSQSLARAEFKALTAEANLSEAFAVARRIDNVNIRVLLLLQLARAAYRKDDISFSRLIMGEARAALSNPEKDGLRARLLLNFAAEASFISEVDAMDVLHNAVLIINSLSKPNTDPSSSDQVANPALAELNDPRTFIDGVELHRAFSSVARVDFDGTLLAAGRINPIPVQLMARLATSEIALTKRTRKIQSIPEKKPAPVDQPKQGT